MEWKKSAREQVLQKYGYGPPHRDSPRPSTNRYPSQYSHDEVEWDSGGIGQWHKQPSNHSNTKSSHAGNVNNQVLLKSVNFSRSTEFVEIWDDQFDFCVKDERENDESDVELNSVNNSPKSRRFSKAKCKEVFIRSKDYIKSKVAICKKKLHVSSSSTRTKGDNSDVVYDESYEEQGGSVDRNKDRRHGQGTRPYNPSINVQVHSCTSNPKGNNSADQEWLNYKQQKKTYPGQFCTGVFASPLLMNGKAQTNKSDTPPSMNGTSHVCQTNGASGDQPVSISAASKEVNNGQVNHESKSTGFTSSISDHLTKRDSDVMPGLIKDKDTKLISDDSGNCENNNNQHEDCNLHDTRPVDGCELETNCPEEEEIPLGSEAQSFEVGLQDGGSLQRPESLANQMIFPVVDKRLQWLMDSGHHQSFGSDFSQNTNTSNSSDISLDMILNDRFESPEDILIGLGFGGSEEQEDPVQRIPDRFLSKPSSVEGLELAALLEDNPELSSLLQSYSLEQHRNEDSYQGCESPQKGKVDSPENLRQIMNSVMHTMKFVSMVQPHKFHHSTPNSHSVSLHSSDDNPGVHSVLHPENREHLAKQGFYDKHKQTGGQGRLFKSVIGEGHRGQGVSRLSKSMSLDAAERRRMFQKSRTPREKSLSDLIESDEPKDQSSSPRDRERSVDFDSDNTSNTQSFDNGFAHKTYFTSIETSTDSFDSTDSPSLYTSSASHIHRGSAAWLNAENVHTDNSKPGCDWSNDYEENSENLGIREMRMKQVDKLMSFDLDDGDYAVNSPASPLRKQASMDKISPHSSLRAKLSTKSSTCTLVGEDDIDFTATETPIFPENVSEVQSEKLGNSDLDIDMEVQGICDNSKSAEREPSVDVSEQTSQVNISDDKICDTEQNVCDRQKKDQNVLTYYFRGGTKSATRDRGTQVCETTPSKGQLSEINPADLCESRDLGGMGRMESIQSDSSGFADGDVCEQVIQENLEKVSSLGSSAESDQTFHSSSTLLPYNEQSTSPGLPASDLRKQLIDSRPNLGQKKVVSHVDVAVGTEDLGKIEQSPTKPSFVTYHLHPREDNDSNSEISEKSVVLTIELPHNWLNAEGQRSEVSVKSSTGEQRVVSHLYKVISPPKNNQDSNIPKLTKSERKVPKGGNLYSLQNSNKFHRPRGRFGDDSQEDVEPRDSGNAKITDFTPDPFVRPIQPKWASTPRTSARPLRRLRPDSPKLSLNLRQSAGSSDGLSSVGSEASIIPTPIHNQLGSGVYNQNIERQQEFCPLTDGDQSDVFSVSIDSSCSSLQDDYIEYTKLMRLVNKPVSFKQIEEETRLTQYALQRYKAELNVLETTFLVNCQLAANSLTTEERLEAEELQNLYSEVRQEIMDMEQLLYHRMSGLQTGNDNFSPLLVLEVIQKMINIIKEQVYQQQINTYKEDMGPPTGSDSEAPFQASQSNVPWWPEVSQQLWEIQQKVSQPASIYSSRQCLDDNLSELRTSILDEVRQELRSSTQWLHRELQTKERELSRLRGEYVSENVKTGNTRVRQFYETDV